MFLPSMSLDIVILNSCQIVTVVQLSCLSSLSFCQQAKVGLGVNFEA
jgi:hypothetical protein